MSSKLSDAENIRRRDDVVEAVRTLYHSEVTGGPWHIVTDDENLEDEFVAYCVDIVARRDHWSFEGMSPAAEVACDTLAELLPLMSVTQRKKAIRMAHGRR